MSGRIGKRRSSQSLCLAALMAALLSPAAQPCLATAPTAQSPSESAKLVDQIRKLAIPIASEDPKMESYDLAALKPLIGDSHIVALGEASHGTSEFFKMKHRVLRSLVEKMGFTVFGMEADWVNAQAIDAYIKTGKGSAREALAGLQYWVWNTQEVLDMIEWMRSYNATRGNRPALSFAGFDIQNPDGAAKLAIAYIDKYDPADAMTAANALSCFSMQFSQPADKPTDATCHASVAGLGALLDSKRGQMIKDSSTDEFQEARQAARIVAQAESVSDGYETRDAAMAENVEWLVKECYPNQRTAIWAHNGHVSTSTGDLSYKPMGEYLREAFGREMFVFGFTFYAGFVRTVPLINGQVVNAPIPVRIAPASDVSFDVILHSVGLPRFILPLRGLRPPLSTWLKEPRAIESIGSELGDFSHEMISSLPETYDALIFFDVSDPSQLLPGSSVPPALVDLTTPVGTGGIQLDAKWKLRFWGGASYAGGADHSVRRGGKASLFLMAKSAASPSSVAELYQPLELHRLLGRRIRVSGVIKTKAADGAACGTQVQGSGGKVSSYDWMENRLIKGTSGWTRFALVLDVPKGSTKVVFGLTLNGGGEMWVNDVEIETVPPNVPVTGKR